MFGWFLIFCYDFVGLLFVYEVCRFVLYGVFVLVEILFGNWFIFWESFINDCGGFFGKVSNGKCWKICCGIMGVYVKGYGVIFGEMFMLYDLGVIEYFLFKILFIGFFMG